MRKIKLVIASMLGVIAVVMAFALGAKANATTVDSGYTAISIGSLKTTAKEISVYGTSVASKAQDVTNDYVAFNSNWNWYNEAINSSVYNDVTNNTGCIFDSLVIATGNSKNFSMKVPAGKTKINCIIYLLCMVKADSTSKQYSLKTSGTTPITIPNSITNLKLDGTTVNSLASISADSTIHKVSFSYEATTQITVDSGMAILGFGVKDDSTTYSIVYNANGHGTPPTYTGSNVAALNNSILGATITGISDYRFTGWYLDNSCETEATTSSILSTYASNGTVTLYAGWEEITEYEIKFYVDSTLYDTKTVDVSGEKKLTDWPDDPTKTNAVFDGWYNGNTKVNANTVFTSDTTLLAKFNLDTIAIGTTKTLNFNDENLTVTNNYYDSQSYNKFTIDSTDSKIKKESSFKFEIAGSIAKNHIAFSIPANSIAKISLVGIRSTSDGTSIKIEITDGSTSKKTEYSVNKDYNVDFTTWENASESDITLYIFRNSDSKGNCKINEISVSVVAREGTKTADTSSLVFKAQYNGSEETFNKGKDNEYIANTSTKLRFIGMIQGISYEDYENITSVTFSFTFNGDRDGEVKTLYKSVKNGSTNMFVEKSNTMYVVYTLRNINKQAYEGQTITNCKLTVTFEDGSELEISHDDIVLPSKFNTYVE